MQSSSNAYVKSPFLRKACAACQEFNTGYDGGIYGNYLISVLESSEDEGEVIDGDVDEDEDKGVDDDEDEEGDLNNGGDDDFMNIPDGIEDGLPFN